MCRYCACSTETKHPVLTRPIPKPSEPIYFGPNVWSPGEENKPEYEHRFKALHAPFEAACLRAGGRPHWGKRSRCSREQVEAMYGEGFAEFVRLRRDVDPTGKFLNTFTRELFE